MRYKLVSSIQLTCQILLGILFAGICCSVVEETLAEEETGVGGQTVNKCQEENLKRMMLERGGEGGGLGAC